METEMANETNLYYFCTPRMDLDVHLPVEILTTQEFLNGEADCKVLWDLVSEHFRTRSKFLTIWTTVRYVAVCRDDDGQIAGMLLISTPINWQIDYVVVRPEARGSGVATALVRAALNHAAQANAPYVMLTSRESLRPLYESCGFSVINAPELVA
jgi:ribosomal protein S18 acetylase RimI-like enzyme